MIANTSLLKLAKFNKSFSRGEQ